MEAPLLLLLAALVCGGGASVIIIEALLTTTPRLRFFRRVSDPHHLPGVIVPRIGGLALVLVFTGFFLALPVLGFPFTFSEHVSTILVASWAMFLIGFIDDLAPIRAWQKLIGQTCVALFVCARGVGILELPSLVTGNCADSGWTGALVTVVWVVMVTNALNLIDGLDGLAGGICILFFAFAFFTGAPGPTASLLSFGMIGALVGFLLYNRSPARIYLGDGGAYFLGCHIALISTVNAENGRNPAALVLPCFALALPILDLIFAVLRRCRIKRHIWQPDRGHIHHRFLELGLSSQAVVVLMWVLTCVFFCLGWLIVEGESASAHLAAVLTGSLVLALGALSIREVSSDATLRTKAVVVTSQNPALPPERSRFSGSGYGQ